MTKKPVQPLLMQVMSGQRARVRRPRASDDWITSFSKGCRSQAVKSAGTVIDGRKVSDHEPVWVRAIVPR